MRLTALIPILCAIASTILGFLLLFAGHKKNFMEEYHVMTLNTSRIGYELVDLNAGDDDDNSNPISEFIDNIGDDLQDQASDLINNAVGSIAEQLGLQDWYSAHLMDYCYGSYLPGPIGNDTTNPKKHVEDCSDRRAMYHFNPTEILQQSLDDSGVPITLEDLRWPDAIQNGLDGLRIAGRAAFVLYCIGIGLSILTLITSVLGLLFSGRATALLNAALALLAFLAFGIASGIVTAVVVKGSNIINKYGDDIGIEAKRGNKFLGLTWGATAAMLICCVWWMVETCIGHRKRRERTYTEKPRTTHVERA
ncbi:hypothetical protein M501DRAFT_1025974 [Patellaria atrata CBS 101060]|uniref:Sur7 protein n=1 Tax=Patellaria atrata CBS 101060 TaxID=1346257 RepID=A0A9P4S5K2_9PEZI|nr:hypothetical protein M501DRAFT_1025974 [Patellaria atrata CBS 101060]